VEENAEQKEGNGASVCMGCGKNSREEERKRGREEEENKKGTEMAKRRPFRSCVSFSLLASLWEGSKDDGDEPQRQRARAAQRSARGQAKKGKPRASQPVGPSVRLKVPTSSPGSSSFLLARLLARSCALSLSFTCSASILLSPACRLPVYCCTDTLGETLPGQGLLCSTSSKAPPVRHDPSQMNNRLHGETRHQCLALSFFPSLSRLHPPR